jgi:2-haloacid dehalogenase
MLDFEQYDVLTFDCYGTLIDWENGILEAIKPLFLKYGISIDDPEILEKYAGYEAKLEEGYIKYREVLKKVIERFADEYKFIPTNDEINLLANSVKNWQPFPDTVKALKVLKNRYQLAIISNIDNDLFAQTQKLLDIEFEQVITAEDIGSYKPSLNNFNFAIKK